MSSVEEYSPGVDQSMHYDWTNHDDVQVTILRTLPTVCSPRTDNSQCVRDIIIPLTAINGFQRRQEHGGRHWRAHL